ncbi:aldose 1-epimerase family protein [Clostridium thermobutyricum]|uniref:aldose 1-epimerase family protein n=1 Tax=Clostridium thermobutyricum TaxID=29372 RepID=UPI0029435350|nr:aldose 1-epimerase family protein [Clostridium thermobutyricum]
MIYTLENSNIKITASPFGGELHNLTSKIDGTEFLWNGNEEFWKYHAPILFPIVGKVKDNKYIVEENTYSLPQHGLARISEFNMIKKTDTSIIFSLPYSSKTLEVYPYKFELQIRYDLIENGVKVSYKVINKDSKEIFFSIGAHPAFMCPIMPEETMNDYYFEFNKKETSSLLTLNAEGYFSHERLPYLNNKNIINLSKEVFKNDALVFDNLNSNKISLKSKNHNKSLTMDFTGFPYMGLWSKPTGSPFVCIEPWFGHSDYEDFTGEFKEKEGIQSLNIDEEFNCSYTITITV